MNKQDTIKNIRQIVNSNSFLVELAQNYLIYGYGFNTFWANNADLTEIQARKIWDIAKTKLI